MKDNRIIKEAKFYLNNQTTLRNMVSIFKRSKSSIHKDLQERLRKINYDMYLLVKEKMKTNFDNKYIQGGLATKIKYKRGIL